MNSLCTWKSYGTQCKYNVFVYGRNVLFPFLICCANYFCLLQCIKTAQVMLMCYFVILLQFFIFGLIFWSVGPNQTHQVMLFLNLWCLIYIELSSIPFDHYSGCNSTRIKYAPLCIYGNGMYVNKKSTFFTHLTWYIIRKVCSAYLLAPPDWHIILYFVAVWLI